MTDADARLKALLGEDLPPAMDAHFRLSVLERMEKRQAAQKLAVVIGAGAGATVLTAILAPQLSQALAPGMMLVAGALLAGVGSLWAVLQIRRPI